jgi:hypothetical protein
MKPMGFFIWRGEAGNSSGMPLAGSKKRPFRFYPERPFVIAYLPASAGQALRLLYA